MKASEPTAERRRLEEWDGSSEIEEHVTFSISQAAEVLKISPLTVRRRIKRGDLPATKMKGPHGQMEYRVSAAAIQAALRSDPARQAREAGGEYAQDYSSDDAAVRATLAGARARLAVTEHRIRDLSAERDRLVEEIRWLRQRVERADDRAEQAERELHAVLPLLPRRSRRDSNPILPGLDLRDDDPAW